MMIFAGILICMFSIGTMQLILATALPSIVAEIGGASLYPWVFSSYMLTSIATIPLFSKMADIYGKKRFFILGMGVFAIGSIYGGLAPEMLHLIIARGLQGIGAGIITPVALAMITDMFPAEKRGNMIGIFGFVQLISNLVSPLLGSFITKQLGWHWVFFLNDLLIVLSIIMVLSGGVYQEDKRSMKASEIDIAGSLIFGGFCILIVSFSDIAGAQGIVSSAGILVFIAAAVTGVLFVLIERGHKNPVIKVEFFKNKMIRRCIISSSLAGAIMYGFVMLLPLCGALLVRQGMKINESSILLLFMVGITIGILAGSRLKSRLMSGAFSRYLWMIITLGSIFTLCAITFGYVLLFNVLNVLMGMCTGGIMATFLINSQNAISSEDRTILSGIIQLGRYFGASIGVTVLTGMIPEINLIISISQFIGAFGLLAALCILGLINEMI